MGLGKRRTRLGEWLDDRGVKQTWLEREGRLSRPTVSSLCNDPAYQPNIKTVQTVLNTLRKVDQNVRADQFWTL